MMMRFRNGLLAMLALVACAGTLSAQETGTITGRLTDAETEAGISGATVQVVTTANRSVGSAITDAEGAFRIGNVPAGTYTLRFDMVGYEAGRVEDVRVIAGETTIAGAVLRTAAFELNPLVVSASKEPEKAVEAPNRTEVVTERQIEERPAITPVDHLRAVPGVDVVTQGVQATNIVLRGFNNIFSGSLHTLTDNRIAGVPSLRVNLLHFVPTTNEDLERMEVVLGPGSALYGPNTAAGVLHMITKSPLDEQGSALSVAGGEQSIFHLTGRTAHRLSDRLGIKVSGQLLRADEWEYNDPTEVAEREKFAADPFFRQDLMRAVGIGAEEADRRIALIADRDFDVERWALEGRADYQVSENFRTIFQAGVTNAASGIELTGLGAAQVKDWKYSYYQARGTWNRFFGQVYLNTSNAGETYLLRNGAPIQDESKLLVGQLQHGFRLGERQNFTYGADYLHTNPETNGTINGIYEEDDETTEIGAYLQSETALSSKFDLVLAGRVDDHSGLPDLIFSPRAALVFKPAETHAFRASYNRAFSTPSSLNQFLDLGSAIPDPGAARLGFSVRVQGTGTNGFRFEQPDGSYLMRSPFTRDPQGNPVPATLLPANAALFFPAAIEVVAAGAAAGGQPIDPQLLGYLRTLRPTSAEVGTRFLHPATGDTGSLANLSLPDVAPIRESTTSTIEFGYKGVFGGKVVLAADLWFERHEDFVTPLTIQTPLLLMNGPQLGAYLVPRFMQDLGMSAQQAQATAAALIGGPTTTGLATIPVAVISSADVNANGAQLLTTYYNVEDELDVWGTDISATALLSDAFSLSGTLSLASDNIFETEGGEAVTLNAPKTKASIAATYRDIARGLNGEIRARYNDEFPVRSGVYNGTLCIGGQELGAEECVDSYTLIDVMLGYSLPIAGASLQLYVQNALDEDYRSFPGVPAVGRMALLRLKYEF